MFHSSILNNGKLNKDFTNTPAKTYSSKNKLLRRQRHINTRLSSPDVEPSDIDSDVQKADDNDYSSPPSSPLSLSQTDEKFEHQSMASSPPTNIASSSSSSSSSSSEEDDSSDIDFSPTSSNSRSNKFLARKNAKLQNKSKGSVQSKIKPTKYLQTVLNFGNHSSNKTCVECGMSYCPTNALDISVHTKFHESSSLGRDWQSDWGEVVWISDVVETKKPHSSTSSTIKTTLPNSEETVNDKEHERKIKPYSREYYASKYKHIANSIGSSEATDKDSSKKRKFSLGRTPSLNTGSVTVRDKIVKITHSNSKIAEKRAVEDLLSCVNSELSAPKENQTWKLGPEGAGAVFVYITSRPPHAFTKEPSSRSNSESSFKSVHTRKEKESPEETSLLKDALDFEKTLYSPNTKGSTNIDRFEMSDTIKTARIIDKTVNTSVSATSSNSSHEVWKAVGVLVVERVKQAHYLKLSTGQIVSNSFNKSSSKTSQGRIKAIMGISRIFTARSFRRCGIATKLLDVASENFVYGLSVPKSMIAWSQPSSSGGKLALTWNSVADRGVSSENKKPRIAASDETNTTENDTQLAKEDLIMIYLERDAVTK